MAYDFKTRLGGAMSVNYGGWLNNLGSFSVSTLESVTPRPIDTNVPNAVLMNAYKIIFFRFWKPITVNGIQIGQDRLDATRKAHMDLAFLALYSTNFCESDIRANLESLASEFGLTLADVYPYQGTKGDAKRLSKIVLTDGQSSPITRIKRGMRKGFDFHLTAEAEQKPITLKNIGTLIIRRFRLSTETTIIFSRAIWSLIFPSRQNRKLHCRETYQTGLIIRLRGLSRANDDTDFARPAICEQLELQIRVRYELKNLTAF